MPLLKGTSPTTKAMSCSSRTEKAALIALGATLALALRAALNRSLRAKKRVLARSTASSLPKEVVSELFSRNLAFFGEDGFEHIREAFVVVVGLGGVGSHAAHMLARAGVRRLRVIDFDQVSLSSLNRHATALWSDVGTPKADSLANSLRKTIPNIEIEAINRMFRAEDAAGMLSGNPAYVLDCIDDVTTKAELLALCFKMGIPVISSMGAALKSDPTRILMGTLRDAVRDPLATKIKWKLKKYMGLSEEDMEHIKCVFSSESLVSSLLPLTEEQQEAPGEFGAVQYLRLRTLPVLGTIPALFGQSMATWTLCNIAGKGFIPRCTGGYGRKLCNKLLQGIRNREWGPQMKGKFPLDPIDAESVVELWSGRCAVTGSRVISGDTYSFVRWDDTKAIDVDNVVLMSQDVVKEYIQGGKGALPPPAVARIEEVLRLMREGFSRKAFMS